MSIKCYCYYSIIKCGMELLIHSQTSTMQWSFSCYITWVSWCLKSPSNLLFVQQLERRKHQLSALHTLCEGNPKMTRCPSQREAFPCRDIIMEFKNAYTSTMVQLAHWRIDKSVIILQTAFSNAVCSIKKLSISFQISLKIVSNGSINNNPTLVQIMAWRRTGDKPLSEPMVA